MDWRKQVPALLFDAHLREDRLHIICEDRQVCRTMNRLPKPDIETSRLQVRGHALHKIARPAGDEIIGILSAGLIIKPGNDLQ